MARLFSSLRFRLILLVSLATLPALLLVIYNGQEQRRYAETDALENALQLAQFAASNNETLIEDTRVVLVSLSHAMNFDGTGLVGCGHLFNHLKEVHFPFYSAFYVADLEANILCSMPEGDLPEDLISCQHYQNLVMAENFVFSEYHLCRNTGKGVISLGYPIWDEQDNKIAVINASIDLAWINEFAVESELPPDSNLMIFDRDGIVLAHYPDPEFWVGKTIPEGATREYILQEKQGTTRGTDIDNIERLYAFMPLSGSEESVFLTLGIPESYAFANVERTTMRNLILVGMVLLFALLAAWFFGEAFVVRQINQIVQTTQRLASGDLSARTNSEGGGEFGILNQSINEMAEALSNREIERKQAEDAIREYAANLERSNRDLMDFANITSHDLQEPLRRISNFSEILILRYSDKLDERGQEYTNRIGASAKRMHNLIIDLLTFSRISTKTQPREKVELKEVLEMVLIDLELQIEQRNGVINIGDMLLIYADPVQVHQLFLNLISNSLKFQKPDISPVVDIVCELKSNHSQQIDVGSSNYHEIRITDNGIGFDEKYLDRIFQPFQRLHQFDEYEGTGMGLAICRKIIERHQGQITAHSKPGEGATFTVRFPFFEDEGAIDE